MIKLLYAIRFLTVIPIPFRRNEDMSKVARSTVFFPVAGFILGGFLYGLALLFDILPGRRI